MGQLLDTAALEDFVEVVRAGSISGAARALGQPKQSVSRRISSLEATLGVRLLNRTTRTLRLTDEGQALHHRAKFILSELAETRHLIAGRAQEPEGLLRISAPNLLGQTLLSAAISEFCLKFSKVVLDVELTDRKVDLMEEGYDAAIRVGPMLDESLIARILARTEAVLVASPTYLSEYGIPNGPSDLAGHSAVLAPVQEKTARWKLERGDEQTVVNLPRRCRLSSIKLAADMATAGVGIALIPMFLVARSIEEGELVHILPGWRGGISNIYVVHPSRRLIAPKLRAFIDLLIRHFAEISTAGISSPRDTAKS